MLIVVYANIDSVPDSPGSLPLSSYRLEKLASCRSVQRCRQGIGAELLLIRTLQLSGLSPALPLAISVEKNGKPILIGSELYFNLSHSGSISACALSDSPVGLDLEQRGRLREPVLRRCFSQEEQALVREAEDPDLRFTRLWTGKESYVKATGQGILSPLCEIQPLDPLPGTAFWQRDLDACCLSVCVLGASAEPDIFQQVILP